MHYLRRPVRYSVSRQTDYCHRAATDETHNRTLGTLPAAKRNIVRLKDTAWIKGWWCYYLQEAPLTNLSPPPTSIFPTLHRELGREFNPASHRGRDIVRKGKKKGAGRVSNSNCLHNRTLLAKQANGQIGRQSRAVGFVAHGLDVLTPGLARYRHSRRLRLLSHWQA